MSMHGCLMTYSAFHCHPAVKNLGHLLTCLSLIHPPLFKDLPCCSMHVIYYVLLLLEACFSAFCQHVEEIHCTLQNFVQYGFFLYSSDMPSFPLRPFELYLSGYIHTIAVDEILILSYLPSAVTLIYKCQ
jgi:hypothetical protein